MISIVCLGDSITASGWPAILEQLLREAGWRSLRCWNAGVRGNTSGQGLRRLEKDALIHQPDLVFIEFGFNDCNVILNGPRPRTAPEVFRANQEFLVTRIQAHGARPVLIANHRTRMLHPLPDGRTYEEHSQDYNAITREVAARCSVSLLDMHALFPGPDLTLEAALTDDDIHLSQAGIAAYARIVADTL